MCVHKKKFESYGFVGRRGKFSKSISDVRVEYPNEIFSKNDLSYKKAFPPEGFRPLNSMFDLSLTFLLS